MFAHPACAEVPTTITTAEQFHELLAQTNAQATRGKTYTLGDDIELDTSDLATNFKDDSNNPSRIFRGVLDGAGHTVAEKAADDGAQPLFDCLGDQSGIQCAEVKNLKLVFEGDARGATLAASGANFGVSNVDVSFKNVVPVSNSRGTVAAGLVGWINAGMRDVASGVPYTLISNVKITGTSVNAANSSASSAVCAAGVMTQSNSVSVSVLDGVNANVGSISATTNKSGSVVAAGAVAGCRGDQAGYRLKNVSVVVGGSISAKTTGTGEVLAVGMAYKPLAVSGCSVAATDIKAIDEGSNAGNNVIACGAFQAGNSHNAEFGAAYASATVNVSGQISSEDASGGEDYAHGFAYSADVTSVWKKTSVTAGSIKAADNGSVADNDSIATGFCQNGWYQGSGVKPFSGQSAEGVTIKANSIDATSKKACAYAFGFEMFGYYPKKACKVEVGSIYAKGPEDSAAAGFTYVINVDKNGAGENAFKTGAFYDGCSVDANSIVAEGSDASGVTSAGFSANNNGFGSFTDVSIDNCSVAIADKLDAVCSGASDATRAGLFTCDNNGGVTKLLNNTVTVPLNQARVQEIEGKRYVRFTAGEDAGQASKTDWYSGNKVMSSDARGGGEVTCAFDSSSDKGTLWRLPDLQYGDLSVTAAATGSGAAASDEFEVTITLDDATINGTFGDMTFTNGVATVGIANGKTLTARVLPEGIGYKVEAKTLDGYSIIAQEGTGGTVSKDKVATASFTFNKEKAPEPTPDKPNRPNTDDSTGKNDGQNTGGSTAGKPSVNADKKRAAAKTLPGTGDSTVVTIAAVVAAGAVVMAAGICLRKRLS